MRPMTCESVWSYEAYLLQQPPYRWAARIELAQHVFASAPEVVHADFQRDARRAVRHEVGAALVARGGGRELRRVQLDETVEGAHVVVVHVLSSLFMHNIARIAPTASLTLGP